MTAATSYEYPRIEGPGKAYYMRLAEDTTSRELVSELIVPRLEGKAFLVPKHHILRVTAIEGPQVADFNAFNEDDPKEMFWSGRNAAAATCPSFGRRPPLVDAATHAPDVHDHRRHRRAQAVAG